MQISLLEQNIVNLYRVNYIISLFPILLSLTKENLKLKCNTITILSFPF